MGHLDIRTTAEHLLEKMETSGEGTLTQATTKRAMELLKFGNAGSVTISGSAAQTPDSKTYWGVMFIKATTPTALTIHRSTCVVGIEYPAGTWLYGDILTITGDANGAYILYKGDPTIIL